MIEKEMQSEIRNATDNALIGTKLSTSRAQRPFTSIDVAKLAGVTQATVSRVINKPHKVAEETRLKVLEVIRSLEYKPSAAARVLVQGRNGVIGLLTPGNPYNSDSLGLIVNGISNVVLENKYLLSIYTFHPRIRVEEIRNSPLISQRTCDGIILNICNIQGDLLECCHHISVPYVLINPPTFQRFDCVTSDDQKSAEIAVNYLIAKGHRRIAYLTGGIKGHQPSLDARERGYEIAMYRAGINPLPLYNQRLDFLMEGSPQVRQENKIAKIKERLNYWSNHSEPATAIVTYNADTAIHLIRAAYLNKWFVPEKLSVIACDDETPLERSIVPITAINLNRPKMAEQATKMLIEKIQNHSENIPSQIIDCHVEERYSVSPI